MITDHYTDYYALYCTDHCNDLHTDHYDNRSIDHYSILPCKYLLINHNDMRELKCKGHPRSYEVTYYNHVYINQRTIPCDNSSQ